MTEAELDNFNIRKSVLIKKCIQLEKENAELKKQLEMSNKVYNDNLDYSHNIEEQLAKAKEIIKGLLSFVDSLGNYSGGIFAKAEQFLKGE